MKLKVELGSVTTLEEFHDTVALALDFPHYYGRNLDAFWDCLTETDDRTEIEIVGLETIQEPLKSKVTQYVSLISEHQEAIKTQKC